MRACVRLSDTIIMRFNSSAEPVLLGLRFPYPGSKGGSEGPRERESDRARVVGVCIVRRGVEVLKPRSCEKKNNSNMRRVTVPSEKNNKRNQ
jgi:hypothetical protein